MSKVADGKIIKIDDDKKLVFGWASIIKDTQGKILLDRQDDFIDSEEELEKAAYDYVLKSRDGGEMHIRKGVSTMVESIVLSEEKQKALGIPHGVVPIGWWVGFKVNDSRVWNEVKKGGYIGFSVHGTGKRDQTELPLNEITEIEKGCGCGEDEPVAKYDPRYFVTMRKAHEHMVSETIEKAKKKKNKVATVMGEFKRGKLKSSSGQVVTNPKQAMAIAISEQRKKMKKGDRPGHPFRGNQWTKGRGGAPAGAKGGAKAGAVKAKNVDEAIKGILAGKEVEFSGDPKGINTMLEKLAKMANDAKAKGKDAPNYDLCKVSVAGTNLFCAGNKGIPRIKMPQIGGKVVEGTKAAKLLDKQNAEAKKAGKEPSDEVNGGDEFQSHLKSLGIKTETKSVPAASLKASQSELVGPKVAGMMSNKDYNPAKKPIFVSRDGYVIDGHHRWAATVGRDLADGKAGDMNMNVVMVDAPISKVLRIANQWANDFGIAPKAAGKKGN